MEEVWKPIKGYEGLYEVSNYGRVRSLDRYVNSASSKTGYQLAKGRILKQCINTETGYSVIQIYKNHKKKGCNVHKLVAEHFIPNPNNYRTVNHKDGNKANNKVDNLEWVSQSDNLIHSYKELKRPVNKPSVHKQKIYYTTKNGKVYYAESIAEASRQTGVSETQIRRLINNKKPSRDGYTFSIIKPSVEDNERVNND